MKHLKRLTALSRPAVLHLSFLAFAAAIVVKAAHVQLWMAPDLRELAKRQQTTSQAIPAPRGAIYDASGTLLVESRPLVRLAVAPREVRRDSRERLVRELTKAGIPPAVIAKARDTSRQWVPLPGRYLAAQVAGLTAVRGVHSEPVLERVPSPLTGLRGLIGHAAPDGAGLDGIELALDSLLRGVAGRAQNMRDGRGRRLLSPDMSRVAPTPGHSVTLTLRLDLQDIAERALSDAVRDTRSRGGDVVVLDPRSGELLALASRRSEARATAATALTEPVEPGSTLKPFIAAALIEEDRVELDEVFETYNGQYTLYGYTLHDVHRAPRMTFKEVIQHSSNIGMAQAAERLTPQEEYEVLRDFGFGVPTGLPFPSEASGLLREPRTWSLLTPSALARGYEILVTPVQLAVAYAAIANGGELLKPALIKQIRNPAGDIVYEHERTVVRRVISRPVASQMRALLKSVVDSGSATRADLVTFAVGGKSGTARRTENGKYVAGDYTATFVGLFPADDPQLVVLVKLDSPDSHGSYYGGQIAAPVTRAVLQAALASRDAVLDRSRLKPRARPATELARAGKDAKRGDAPKANEADDEEPAAEADGGGTVRYVLNVASGAPPKAPLPGLRAVPDVRGLSARGAVVALHRAGFRVTLIRRGGRGETVPSAGVMARAGTLVRLHVGGT